MPTVLGRIVVSVVCAAGLWVPGFAGAASAEANADALITDYYQSILGRQPDAQGLDFWRSQGELIQAIGGDVTETWRALAITFFESPEYRGGSPSDGDYLADLYTTFRRPPDAQGFDYWMAQLQAGLPRETVLLWFLFSPEFDAYMAGLFGQTQARAETQMVVDFYRGFLNRLPDADGFKYWVTRFRTAQCSGAQAVFQEVDTISTQFLASPDYASRARTNPDYVTDLYDAFLRRGADLGGFLYWKDGLDQGAGREVLRQAFLQSPEFLKRVGDVVAQGCATLAVASNLSAAVADQSVSPFVAVVELRGLNVESIDSVTFLVAPKPTAASHPVQATYSAAYLARSGYGSTGAYGYRVPVFGLYAGYANNVTVRASFADGSTALAGVPITTAAFQDPTTVYDRPNILKRRDQAAQLGFQYFYIKSELTTPIVMDTDGEVRWWVPGDDFSVTTLFERNGFTAGIGGMALLRTELDGRRSEVTIPSSIYWEMHHNLDPGRSGVLVPVDGALDGQVDLENNLIEVAPDGSVVKEWRFGDILSAYMLANGDDPSAFARLGVDWFHMNATAYDPRDNTIIASSRENFLIKVRYDTGQPVWILGDPTKYWHTFPSLRALAITLQSPGLYPIGQHAVSVLPDGEVMVFNNGAASLQSPPGAPLGASRTYSTVSAYTINPATRTAQETRRFDYGKSILSAFCSSAYLSGASMLVSYARADDGAHARLVGVGADNAVVFDIELVNPGGCNTSFNAVPLPFDAMVFQ